MHYEVYSMNQTYERQIMKTEIQFLLFCSLTLISSAMAQQTSIQNDKHRITVNGEAVVNVKPDNIIITFGIETRDMNIMEAKQKNNYILKKALSSFKECGVMDKDVQTNYLTIQPRWENGYKKENFIGYFVNNTIVITLIDVDKVEELVTKTLLAGVNYIHGIDFQNTELKKYRPSKGIGS